MSDVMLDRNPLGGRPQQLGKLIIRRGDEVDITMFKASSSIRIFLGYCGCGKKITAGEDQAAILLEALKKNIVIVESKPKEALNVKIGKMLMGYTQPA